MTSIKNWIFGGGGAVAIVILFAFIDWRIDVKVAEQLSKQDLGTDAKIVSMDDNIASNSARVSAVEASGALTQRQLEQVAQILMQKPR